MTRIITLAVLLSISFIHLHSESSGLSGKLAALPEALPQGETPEKDWLIDGESFVSTVGRTPDGKGIVLTNGLVSRIFRVLPNLSTIDIYNVPDMGTMLIGSSKCGIGYREVNWSLPRARQIILGRGNGIPRTAGLSSLWFSTTEEVLQLPLNRWTNTWIHTRRT